jgi:hypothetical protein
MAELTLKQRRDNRALVLQALKQETGSSGGDAAKDRVKAYCDDPNGAASKDHVFVGALRLVRFYVDSAKPNNSERRGLWQEVRTRMGKPVSATPASINGTTTVAMLQLLAEERP